jgi:hypothetical protein
MFDLNKTTAERESSGVWADFNGGKFKIAHTNNMVFQREITRLQSPFRKKIDKGNLDPKIQLDIMCKAMARGILLDWKNVGAEGKEVEFSEESAINVLSLNSDLREFVQDYALDLENYRDEELEDTGKP